MLKIRILQHLGKKVGMFKGSVFTQRHGVKSFSVLCETGDQREADRRERFYFHQLSFENPNWVVDMGRSW